MDEVSIFSNFHDYRFFYVKHLETTFVKKQNVPGICIRGVTVPPKETKTRTWGLFHRFFSISRLVRSSTCSKLMTVFNEWQGGALFFHMFAIYRDTYTFMYDIGGFKEQHQDAFDDPKKIQ